jgi:hypothetical protein
VQSHYGALVERLTKLRVPDKFSQPLPFDDDAQRILVEVEQKNISLGVGGNQPKASQPYW